MAPSLAAVLLGASLLEVPTWASVRRDGTFCFNTNGAALNRDGQGCLAYPLSIAGTCDSGKDDGDFVAQTMCCACGGGVVSQVPTFVGCYADNVNDRDLPVRIGTGLSLEQCAGACSAANYPYFGRQWLEECHCGNSYGRLGASTGCQCNSTQIGGDVNCVYNFTQAAIATCADTDNTARGLDGNGCGHYYWKQSVAYGTGCTGQELGNFNASRMCCACGGGEAKAGGPWCFEADDTTADSRGNLCQWYYSDPLQCGRYDTASFHANTSCCACGGGRQEVGLSAAASSTGTTTLHPSSQDSFNLTMRVDGVELTSLNANATLLSQFKAAMTGVVSNATGVAGQYIALALSAGSVIVEATVSPPVGSYNLTAVASTVLSSSSSIANMTLASLLAIPGISAVITSGASIAVVVQQVAQAAAQSTTTAPTRNIQVTGSAPGTSALLAAAVAVGASLFHAVF